MIAPVSDSRGEFMLIVFRKIGNHKLMELSRPTTCTSWRRRARSRPT